MRRALKLLGFLTLPVLTAAAVGACGGSDDEGSPEADASASIDGAALSTSDATVDGASSALDAALAFDAGDAADASDAADAADASDAAADAASDAPSTATVTVQVVGDGAGTVALDPPGGTYAPGTMVTLTATATTGVFAGWQGAGCTGNGTCVLAAGAGTVVTAAFGHSYTAKYTAMLNDYTEVQGENGTTATCVYTDDSASGTLTLALAHLAGGAVTGTASASCLCDAVNSGPLVCDSLDTYCEDMSGAISGTTTSFTANLTALRDAITLTGAAGTSVTGTLSFSVYPPEGTKPNTGTTSTLTLSEQ